MGTPTDSSFRLRQVFENTTATPLVIGYLLHRPSSQPRSCSPPGVDGCPASGYNIVATAARQARYNYQCNSLDTLCSDKKFAPGTIFSGMAWSVVGNDPCSVSTYCCLLLFVLMWNHIIVGCATDDSNYDCKPTMNRCTLNYMRIFEQTMYWIVLISFRGLVTFHAACNWNPSLPKVPLLPDRPISSLVSNRIRQKQANHLQLISRQQQEVKRASKVVTR